MKRLWGALLAVLLLAPAARGEMIGVQNHRQWQSFIVQEGSTAVGRMMTMDSSEEVLLVVDFVPSQCGGIPRFIVPARGTVPEQKTSRLRGKFRIDTQPIHDVTYMLYPSTDAYIIEIEGAYGNQIFQEAVRGTTVRFRFESPRASQKDVYIRFSLMGFTAAWQRASSLCRQIDASRLYEPDDEQYFREVPKPRQLPDTAYF